MVALRRYTHSVSKHLVDIDNDLLAEATSILGASTMKEAVNRSLESVVLAARRRSHADRLASMNGLDLGDASVMSDAWH
jgi:Arc/MetJ family transcription regulator